MKENGTNIVGTLHISGKTIPYTSINDFIRDYRETIDVAGLGAARASSDNPEVKYEIYKVISDEIGLYPWEKERYLEALKNGTGIDAYPFEEYYEHFNKKSHSIVNARITNQKIKQLKVLIKQIKTELLPQWKEYVAWNKKLDEITAQEASSSRIITLLKKVGFSVPDEKEDLMQRINLLDSEFKANHRNVIEKSRELTKSINLDLKNMFDSFTSFEYQFFTCFDELQDKSEFIKSTFIGLALPTNQSLNEWSQNIQDFIASTKSQIEKQPENLEQTLCFDSPENDFDDTFEME